MAQVPLPPHAFATICLLPAVVIVEGAVCVKNLAKAYIAGVHIYPGPIVIALGEHLGFGRIACQQLCSIRL